MKNKTVIVNFVARHSLLGVEKMVSGLASNGCRILAVVSKNMPEIHNWRKMKRVELYETDGYTGMMDFFPKLLIFLIKDRPHLRRRARALHAQTVYIPFATYWSMAVNLAFPNTELVYTMHDPIPHDTRRFVINAINRSLCRKAGKVVILSDLYRKLLKKYYGKKEADILTIPYGNESVESSAVRTETVHYDNDKVNFLFQGRIDRYKGLHILSKAYGKLRKKYENITLTVACSGDFTEYEDEYAKLKDCTVINRWLSNEEVRGLFNDSSVVTILPYITATQSGVINTAMPNGSPVIASRCGGITEQIEDGKTGYLVKPGSVSALYKKMEYVVCHRDELSMIRANAYKRIQSLDWKVLAARLAAAL